jgi:hypothetical protein
LDDLTLTGWEGMIATVNCSNLVETADSSQHLLITVVYSKRIGDGNRMLNATALLCKPYYKIGSAIVLQDRTIPSQEAIDLTPIPGSTRQLPGLSSWDIGFGVWNSINYFYEASAQSPATAPSIAQSSGGNTGNSNSTVVTRTDDFFGLMLAADPDVPLSAYMDPQKLISASRQVFRSLSGQLAHQYLLSPAQITLQGSYSGFSIASLSRRFHFA